MHSIFAAGDDQDLLANLKVGFGAGLVGWVAENIKPLVNGNPSVEPGAERWPRKGILQSALSVPVMDGDVVMGVVAVYQRASDAFHRNQTAILESVARRLVPLLARGKAESNPATMAVDPATGLLDGTAFFASADTAIQEAAASGAALSFLLIEVFCLHQINNQLGRVAGDRVLTEFAQRLRTAFRGSDLIARLSSEEFAVLAVGAISSTLASRANNLAANLTEVFTSLCPDIRVRASVGVAEMPHDGQSVEELLAKAEMRLDSSGLDKLCHAIGEHAPAGGVETQAPA